MVVIYFNSCILNIFYCWTGFVSSWRRMLWKIQKQAATLLTQDSTPRSMHHTPRYLARDHLCNSRFLASFYQCWPLHVVSVQIDRKLVKQTVMTSVYGVTFVGARMQILNRLRERGNITEQVEMYRAASYAAKVRTCFELRHLFHLTMHSWLLETIASATAIGSLIVFYFLHTDNVKRPGRNVQRSPLHYELAWRLCEGKITYLNIWLRIYLVDVVNHIGTSQALLISLQLKCLISCLLVVFHTNSCVLNRLLPQVEKLWNGLLHLGFQWCSLIASLADTWYGFLLKNYLLSAVVNESHSLEFKSTSSLIELWLCIRVQVKTSLQILALRNLDAHQPVLVQRQKSAFPPNFVHSLDSTHMMMTALACQEAGINFAGKIRTREICRSLLSVDLFLLLAYTYKFFVVNLTPGVHDSYWTHAGDADVLKRLLREKFVELYEQPVLEDVS